MATHLPVEIILVHSDEWADAKIKFSVVSGIPKFNDLSFLNILSFADEIHRLHSGGTGREVDFLVEQKLDKLRQEMTEEFKLMNQKYNCLKNRDEETAVAMEMKNSSVTSTIIDL